MRLVAYVPDLMDRSRVSAVAGDATFVTGADELVVAAGGADLVVVDLGRPGVAGVLPDLVAAGARVVGFGSHVERATLDQAAAAGCEAMPRSQFFRSLGELLTP